MDPTEVRAAFDRQMRGNAPPDGVGARVERVRDVVRQTGSAHDWNGVLWSDLQDGTAARAIAEQVEHFSSLGREFEWKLYSHDRPDTLADLLRAAGFTPGPAESLMVAESAAQADAPGPPDGVRLLPVTDAAGVDLLADVHEAAFGEDGTALRRRLRARLAEAPETLVAVVALADGSAVSASRMELTPGTDFAGLWGGGTVPGWRGRGLYRAQIAFRARIAAARGYRWLQVDAAPMSRPVLQRLGFTELGTTTPYVYKP
ncbi:GNAT family N-acetyltransferase [Streptomyces corynorhini]|uniref:GNAT family N-acetyltransferase n=1 Tax=Streptomyces corynorhini TaxID=2282652 RepID=A0A370B5S9_9ACTN|nr:GNAT family N-acetyltransferase [Streptomyces corynorhini]RDG37160.1 GNAT family N-acetyltransferase [Streptomyces corynorhini]